MTARFAVLAPLLLVVTGLGAGGPASAQADLAQCAGRAGLYAGEKGLRIWVLRAGTLLEENPLRPLSPDRLMILDVVVNGRAATALGPDAMNLRQGGPAARIEASAAEPIRWRAPGEALPTALRVVAEDGRVLLDGLRFAECGDAPKPGAAPAPRRETPGAGRRDPAPDDGRPARRLPQGAIPGMDLR